MNETTALPPLHKNSPLLTNLNYALPNLMEDQGLTFPLERYGLKLIFYTNKFILLRIQQLIETERGRGTTGEGGVEGSCLI
jgi:hypothetical protein